MYSEGVDEGEYKHPCYAIASHGVLIPQNALLQMRYLLRNVCILFSMIHSFEVTMHYGPCNAHCTLIYAIMDVAHNLYVEECPLGSCIPRFEGTTQGWEPENLKLHNPEGHSPMYNDDVGICTYH